MVLLVLVLAVMFVAVLVLAVAALLVLVLAVVSMVGLELNQGRLLLVLQVRLEVEEAPRWALLSHVQLQGVGASHWALLLLRVRLDVVRASYWALLPPAMANAPGRARCCQCGGQW